MTAGAGLGPDPDRGWKLGVGALAAAFVALFVGGSFAALAASSGGLADPGALLRDAYLRGVVLFTLEQASLSAAISVGAAVPLAVALHRARFPGRAVVLRLLLLPQALPALVGALAILAVWGRAGLASQGLAVAGLPPLDLYGLPGILVAHVFFNLPLATRLILAALDAVPAESWKLAGQLSFGARTTFRIVEWPAIRPVLFGAAGLVFMLCVTSFTLVLVLGGGPNATTLEVAIYQSLRYAFDPGRAVVLALAQIGLAGAVLAVLLRLGGGVAATAFTLGRQPMRYDRQSLVLRLVQGLVIALAAGFVAAPFAVVLIRGLGADLVRLIGEPGVRQAALTSAALAFPAAGLALLLSLGLLFGGQALKRGGRGPGTPSRFSAASLDLAASVVLVVPPIVVGTGWFLMLRTVTDVFAAAPYVVIATNAVMAVPFALRILGPALAASALRYDRLAAHLGLTGLARLRHVEAPALRTPLGLAFAFALALSLGDLGVVALYGNEHLVTLPLLLLQRMGSYRTADAAGLALILGVLVLVLMTLAERGAASAHGAAGGQTAS